jgi:hypothetical protein
MNEDAHVGGIASALVMLAAVATTFTTYGIYKDEDLAGKYESDQVALEQTASALMSLRLEEEAMVAVEADEASTTESAELE